MDDGRFLDVSKFLRSERFREQLTPPTGNSAKRVIVPGHDIWPKSTIGQSGSEMLDLGIWAGRAFRPPWDL